MAYLISFFIALFAVIGPIFAHNLADKTYPADLYIFPAFHKEAIAFWQNNLNLKQSDITTMTQNRYQEKLLHGFDDNQKSLQEMILKKGWAIYYSDQKTPSPSAAGYLKAEQDAIQNKLGLWADPAQNPLRNADTLTDADAGKILIVQGTVYDVYQRKDVIYLNFSANWRDDFTIRVRPKNAKFFAKNGMALENLKGKKLEIRGYSFAQNGIMMDWDELWQVRMLAQN
jgi:hypothetical protein